VHTRYLFRSQFHFSDFVLYIQLMQGPNFPFIKMPNVLHVR